MIVIRGHLGFGDCIHQRAILRTLYEMGERDIVLDTFYDAMYWDLQTHNELRLREIKGHPARVRESNKRFMSHVRITPDARHVRMRYNAETVHRHGSILAAQYACAGLEMPERPDFSLVVPDEWRAMWHRIKRSISKPIMVYRPLVLNKLFHCDQRLPDVDTYATLFKSIRDKYHVVSVCNLGDYGEHIVGPEMPVDMAFHHGQLPFEQLVGLYAEADLAFTCAGFAPVLAQAVGTKNVIVYGGHEGYKTTNIVGAHLAPTLAIEAINQCECHGGHYTRGPNQELVKPEKTHDCDKTIDLDAALRRLKEFTEERQHADA